MALPLDGVKVLDFSRFLSGPYCTSVLADMGAEVTKVERYPDGDDARRLEPGELSVCHGEPEQAEPVSGSEVRRGA